MQVQALSVELRLVVFYRNDAIGCFALQPSSLPGFFEVASGASNAVLPSSMKYRHFFASTALIQVTDSFCSKSSLYITIMDNLPVRIARQREVLQRDKTRYLFSRSISRQAGLFEG